jgi:hypothetical protein
LIPRERQSPDWRRLEPYECPAPRLDHPRREEARAASSQGICLSCLIASVGFSHHISANSASGCSKISTLFFQFTDAPIRLLHRVKERNKNRLANPATLKHRSLLPRVASERCVYARISDRISRPIWWIAFIRKRVSGSVAPNRCSVGGMSPMSNRIAGARLMVKFQHAVKRHRDKNSKDGGASIHELEGVHQA